MAHQVDDIGGTHIIISNSRVRANQPFQSEIFQKIPNLVPYNIGKEAPKNELYGKDEPYNIVQTMNLLLDL